MFHSWLDKWDEQRAQNGEADKTPSEFTVDAELAFPNVSSITTIEGFCSHAEQVSKDPEFFQRPDSNLKLFNMNGSLLSFPSGLVTDIQENNVVRALITENPDARHAVVVFHQWNAKKRKPQIARFLSRSGLTVAEIALPYHLERSRPGSLYADYMLGPNLGRTIQSVRQAVWDGQQLIYWLKNNGYEKISVLGFSLGSWVAGLVAAHDLSVSKASLFLTAGSLADMVWTGRATGSIRKSLEPQISLPALRRAWAPLDLGNYVKELARPELSVQLVIAKRDKVVLPSLSCQLVQSLQEAGSKPSVMELNCGHYSISMLPYILRSGYSLRTFMLR